MRGESYTLPTSSKTMARIETIEQKQNRLFSEWVIVHLYERGERQNDLANGLGMTPQTISNKIQRKRKWTLDDMAAICEYFHESYTVAR